LLGDSEFTRLLWLDSSSVAKKSNTPIIVTCC
jgi:hypothetical protein